VRGSWTNLVQMKTRILKSKGIAVKHGGEEEQTSTSIGDGISSVDGILVDCILNG
jgi:hypothetical protein